MAFHKIIITLSYILLFILVFVALVVYEVNPAALSDSFLITISLIILAFIIILQTVGYKSKKYSNSKFVLVISEEEEELINILIILKENKIDRAGIDNFYKLQYFTRNKNLGLIAIINKRNFINDEERDYYISTRDIFINKIRFPIIIIDSIYDNQINRFKENGFIKDYIVLNEETGQMEFINKIIKLIKHQTN